MADELTSLRAYHQEWEDRVKWCERALRSRVPVPFEIHTDGQGIPTVGLRRVTTEEEIHNLHAALINKTATENKLLAQIQRMSEEIAKLQKESALVSECSRKNNNALVDKLENAWVDLAMSQEECRILKKERDELKKDNEMLRVQTADAQRGPR